MNYRMLLTRYVAVEVEQVYDKASKLGKLAARIFGHRAERSRSQLTNLLNVANRATSPANVISHIKNQAGKHNEWRQDDFAGHLLQVLEEDLKTAARSIAAKLPTALGETDYEFLEIHLQLMREFIIHMTSQYEYTRAENASTKESGTRQRGSNMRDARARGGRHPGFRGNAGGQDRYRGGAR